MSWQETDELEQRMLFVSACLVGDKSMSAICDEFGVSRKTGYKWLARYQSQGAAGLNSHSRAPHSPGGRIAADVEAAIVQARLAHARWGALKLRAWLCREQPEMSWPAPSTIGAVLARHDLSQPVRPRARTPRAESILCDPRSPNVSWGADFKGWFRTSDGIPCYPFTVSDGWSRYVLCVQALLTTTAACVQPLLIALFREYGLPWSLRTDNGPPFASTGVGGFSRLSVWWARLGIYHERIQPGCPGQNGRHERMHRTLKADTANPPQAHCQAQQLCFDQWRQEFNQVRPHQAVVHPILGQAPPATRYERSSRPYPECLPELQYDSDMQVRRVRSNGQIKWRGELIFVGEALRGERVGLQEIGAGQQALFVGAMPVAIWNEAQAQWLTQRASRALLEPLKPIPNPPQNRLKEN
jgi:transposase InsO family protein